MKCRKIVFYLIAVIVMGLVLSSCVNVRKVLGGSDADDKLFLGIKYENLEMIKEAVDDGADINHLKGIITPETNPLRIAYKHVKGKNERVPEFLIKIGADVNYLSDGHSLLMWAASNTDVHDCEFLLSHGAKADLENGGYTALEYALDNMGIASATEKNINKIVTLLLNHGAKIRPITLKAALKGKLIDITPNLSIQKRILEGLLENGYQSGLDPALEAAMLGQSTKLIKIIKDKGIEEENQWNILCFTAAFGTVEAIKELESKGLDLAMVDRNKYNSLMIASYYGNIDVVKYLISRGIDIEAKNTMDNKKALNLAVLNGQYNTVKYLIMMGADIKPYIRELGSGRVNVLHDAAENGNVEIIKMLIDNGYPINDEVLCNAASIACSAKNYDAAKYFLDRGLDINKSNLYVAVSDLDDIKFLLSIGVSIDGFYNQGEFLRGAIACGRIDSVEYLLKNGANIYAGGYSSLMNAICCGDFDVVKMLIEHGADLEFKDVRENNDTAIMVAAENGSRNILKYIIEKGANVNYQNIKGETALIRAVLKGAKDNVKILIENNADINLKDRNGNTAMDYAKKSKYNDIVKILSNAK